MTLLGSAYDLLSTRLLIPAEVDPEEMALPLNGKKSKIQLQDFEKFSQTLGLTTKQYQNSMNHFRKNVNTAIEFIEQSFLSKTKRAEYKELILTRIRDLKLVNKT